MKREYINNDVTAGIVIDWKKIQKELIALDIPDDVYCPSLPIESANYFIELSERSTGKTTQYLLIGLLLYKEYGIRTEYIRTRSEMTEKKSISNLYNVIIEYGYLDKIFGGKWDSMTYLAGQWHLVKHNEDGEIVDRDQDICCFCHNLSAKHVDTMKSSYNSPLGDWIVFDEFIPVNGITPEGEFLRFIQLLSTIKRMRRSTKIILCANTINKHNTYFQEFNIRRETTSLKIGESKLVTTPKGTPVYVHLIGLNERITDKRQFINNLYFGFDNPHLTSVVGGAEWELSNYPHLPKKEIEETRRDISREYYFKFLDEVLTLKVCKSSVLGTYGFIHEKTTAIPEEDPCRIYTLETKTDKRERFGFSQGDLIDKFIVMLYDTKQMFYATNEVGNLFENFILQYKEGGYT